MLLLVRYSQQTRTNSHAMRTSAGIALVCMFAGFPRCGKDIILFNANLIPRSPIRVYIMHCCCYHNEQMALRPDNKTPRQASRRHRHRNRPGAVLSSKYGNIWAFPPLLETKLLKPPRSHGNRPPITSGLE